MESLTSSTTNTKNNTQSLIKKLTNTSNTSSSRDQDDKLSFAKNSIFDIQKGNPVEIKKSNLISRNYIYKYLKYCIVYDILNYFFYLIISSKFKLIELD